MRARLDHEESPEEGEPPLSSLWSNVTSPLRVITTWTMRCGVGRDGSNVYVC